MVVARSDMRITAQSATFLADDEAEFDMGLEVLDAVGDVYTLVFQVLAPCDVGGLVETGGATPKQTVEARRKQLGEAIEVALASLGWRKVSGTSPHTYERTTSPEKTDHLIHIA